MILFCSDLVKESRKMLWMMPMVLRYLVNRPSVVLVCASRNCSFTGSLCSNEVSHELILLGSGTI